MKKLRILFLCFGLILSATGAAESKQRQRRQWEIKTPPAAPTVQNEIPNVFRPIRIFFKRLFGIRRGAVYCPPPASVKSLTLSRTEVFSSCSADGKSCSDNERQTIEIFTEGVDPENDVLLYHYMVSGGKIIGQGAKVVWDLSGVKPGTYTITAGVDDGCGVCGTTETKQVTMRECPNCNQEGKPESANENPG